MTREQLLQEQTKLLGEIKSELDANRQNSSRLERLDEQYTEVKDAIQKLDSMIAELSQPAPSRESIYNAKNFAKAILDHEGVKAMQAEYQSKKKLVDNNRPISLEIPGMTSPVGYKNAIGITYGQGDTRTVPADIRTSLARYDYPEMVLPPLRPLRVYDVLNKVRTQADYIEYVKETALSTNATGGTSEGSAKPSASTTTAVSRKMVNTFAHHTTAPLQLLADVGRFQNYLENRLTHRLQMVLEDQYLYGNGTDPNLEGLLVVSGTQTQNQLGNNRIETIRKAMTKLEVAFYDRPDALLMHPNDVEFLDLLKGTDGHYLWVDMGRNGQDTPYGNIFRVPVISTVAINEGTGLLGNFKQACTLFEREGVSVRMSFDHDDNFTKNLVTILVELRQVLICELPEALCRINFGNQY